MPCWRPKRSMPPSSPEQQRRVELACIEQQNAQRSEPYRRPHRMTKLAGGPILARGIHPEQAYTRVL
eukprot:scaffold952_cov409-Prasinococcus_capsulatus_cf.AAC.52